MEKRRVLDKDRRGKEEGGREDHTQHLLISHTVDIAIDVACQVSAGECGAIDTVGEAGKAIEVVIEGSDWWGGGWFWDARRCSSLARRAISRILRSASLALRSAKW